MKRFYILIFCLCSFASIYSEIYYSAPNATGNGSSANNAGDLTTLIKKLKAGDTLYLLAGQYDLQNIQLSASGTSAQPITVCNAPDVTAKTPIFDFRTQAYGSRGLQLRETANYWIISGITLRYSGKNALHNSGSNNIFSNLDVYGNGDTGVQMKAGGNNQIINVDSHHNCDYELGGLTAADFGGNADGFADKQYTGGANTYIGCRAWANSDDGWDFFQRVTNGTETTKLIGCICYQNGPEYYDFTNHGRYQTDKKWFDQFAKEITITDADGNQLKASLARYPNIGNGNGFKLGGQETKNSVLLERCLAVANTVKGFDQNNNFGSMTLYNCSAYLNGIDYGFNNNGGGALLVRNSISYKSIGANVFRSANTVTDHNSWDTQGITVSDDDFLSLDTTLILSARSEDGTLPQVAFMRLQQNSKLVDAGVDVGLSFIGNAPDYGCYEYGSGDIIMPATLVLTSGTLAQTIRLGDSITPTTLTWGGSAEDVVYTDLPKGLAVNKNTSDSTLTISGTPTDIGTYTVKFTTTGTTTAKSLSLKLIVKPQGSTYKLAYITLPDDNRDKLILDKLNNDEYFDISIVDATLVNDYTDYDLLVISPVPNSNAAGLAQLKAVSQPTLLLKPFMLKSSVWNWGNSQNTGDDRIYVTQPSHIIFQGITIGSDSTIQMFSQVTTNGVTCINGWYNCEPTELARPHSTQGQAIVEAHMGDNMNGTNIGAAFLMIGISEYSTEYLTDDATHLIDNACRYLLSLNIDTTITDISSRNSINSNVIYSIMGVEVGKDKAALNSLPAGLYIVNGKKVIKLQ